MSPSELASLVDCSSQPSENLTGYVAEMHASVAGITLVWAPCGCVWIGSESSLPFVTACMKPSCTFSWVETQKALEALKLAQQLAQDTKPDDNGVAPSGDCCVPVDAPSAESGPTEPSPAVAPAPGEAPASEAADMISEGGPVQFGDD